MPTGTIARLLIDKGFGFIRDEGGIEHFFHRSAVRGAVFELLREGQRVEFNAEDSGKGPRAGGARSVGVATGQYDRESLVAAGADVVFHDFSDVDEVRRVFAGTDPARRA